MTKKDYFILAAVVGHQRASVRAWADPDFAQLGLRALDGLQHRLRLELRIDNPKFDPAKFDKAVQKFEDEAL